MLMLIDLDTHFKLQTFIYKLCWRNNVGNYINLILCVIWTLISALIDLKQNSSCSK